MPGCAYNAAPKSMGNGEYPDFADFAYSDHGHIAWAIFVLLFNNLLEVPSYTAHSIQNAANEVCGCG